jgi:hypothetical protein
VNHIHKLHNSPERGIGEKRDSDVLSNALANSPLRVLSTNSAAAATSVAFLEGVTDGKFGSIKKVLSPVNELIEGGRTPVAASN